MNIDLSQYELHKVDSVSLINKEINCVDITVEDDNTFHLKNNLGYMLTHNCDGYHIKGLLMGFCYEFITPIIVAKKGKDKKEYYDLNQYNKDKEANKLDGYNIKYYKGLGTILPDDMKLMFKDINKHLIKFNYDKERDNDTIDKIFNNKRANERKDWLLDYKSDIVPNKFGKPNEISNFIDTEFVQFSNADNMRSIPQLMDGLKPSQRKILYAAFKRNLKDEMKVAQFGAYVAEVTHYASGESNLSGTIVNMSQDFVGTNNINLFMPKGQFGSRQNPGASASPRYIFTHLNPITRKIYRQEDDEILNYLYEDEDQIEPNYYLPIIPMILVNGSDGIGTGWSTNIPKYSPDAIIQVIKKKLDKPEIKYKINPWYNKFIGDMDFNDEKGSYITYGSYTKTKKGVIINELPIDCWTEKYISTLNKLCDDKVIKNYIDNSTDIKVNIEIIFNNDDKWKDEQIHQKLKLTSNINLSNMHTFVDNKMTKWSSAEDMLNDWFNLRLAYYSIRKEKRTIFLSKQYKKQQAIYQFIEQVINENIIINRKTKIQITKQLEDAGFPLFENTYDYLMNIQVYWFSKEKLDNIKEELDKKKEELKLYKSLEPKDIWKAELDELHKDVKKLLIL
jgi:DNA topoisomerase-2